jgi:hypothetical protein
MKRRSFQKSLQASIRIVEEKLCKTTYPNCMAAWPQRDHNNKQETNIVIHREHTLSSLRHHADCAPAETEHFGTNDDDDAAKSLSQSNRPKSSNQFLMNRCQSMPITLAKTELDVSLRRHLIGVLSCSAKESPPRPAPGVAVASLTHCDDAKIPFSSSSTIMLPARTTRPAFGDNDTTTILWHGRQNIIPKNMAAPISPTRVTSPEQNQRKSMTPLRNRKKQHPKCTKRNGTQF